MNYKISEFKTGKLKWDIIVPGDIVELDNQNIDNETKEGIFDRASEINCNVFGTDLPTGQKLLTFVAQKNIISRQEDKRPGKSKSKKERADAIENVLEILNDNRIKKEDLNSSMFLLISSIQNEPGEDSPYSTKALIMGSETSFYTPIAAMLEDPNMPDFFKKNIFLAVANTIVEMGPMGLAIGKLLWEFIEREMDGINCECPKCQARKKAKIIKDININ